MTRRRVAVIVGVWLFLALSLGLAGAEPEVLALAGLVAAGGAVVIVAIELMTQAAPVVWERRPPRSDREGSDRYTVTLRRQMTSGRRLESPELRDSLVALVDDRLLAHHGIDRSVDPDAAMRLLDPALQRLVGERRPPSMRELRRIVPAIEAL